MIDTHKHQGKRKKLVDLLASQGIEDKNVLNAINAIPRHWFIDSAFEDFAYEDKAFPIASHQTISNPFTVAFQTQLLQLHIDEKVLEIGTGSGYQTAVLLKMKAEVFTIERQKSLVDFSRVMFKKLNVKPKVQRFGDGYEGLPMFAPFDKILVTAGAPFVPKKLLEQLKIGGILVIPLGMSDQIMTTILRLGDNSFEKTEFGKCQFVPMLEQTSKLR